MRGSRRLRYAALLAITAFVAMACSADEEPGEADEPPARFGTADGELLVLAESDAPRDMTLRADISGPQSIYQYTGDPERAGKLRELGALAGYLQQFNIETSADGEPILSQPLKATTLYSEVFIFDDNDGAADALAYLRDNPNPALDDVAFQDADEFGEGAVLQTSASGDFGNAGYYWRTDNALVSVIAQRQGGEPDADELLGLAREVAKSVASAEATGEALQLPDAPQPGEVIFEDDFEQEGDWPLVVEGDPPGSKLTRYVGGTFQVGIDGPGGRWHDTSELGEGELGRIEGSVVEVDAEVQEGDTARWGLMCDVEKGAGFYLFVVGADGFAGIFSATSPNQPLDAMATVFEHASLEEAIANGWHKIRVDCAGDPIARLALYVNDGLILEAYDDDPLPEGAAGMWIESQETPASVLYDNLVISGVSAE